MKIPRRQLLTAAASLGVAPWLLSACAGTPGAVGDTLPRFLSATRRRLGPLEVFPIGLGCQWHPGRSPQAVNDLYASSLGSTSIRRPVSDAVDSTAGPNTSGRWWRLSCGVC